MVVNCGLLLCGHMPCFLLHSSTSVEVYRNNLSYRLRVLGCQLAVLLFSLRVLY
ncbi:hypothetical protein BC629DRAFT_690001 [Irpex lacteus]|nr:hypothetical protein BC629DRAFT_690001 [Irpex lacteus]